VTVKLNTTPGFGFDGPLSRNREVGPGFTMMVFEVPVIERFTESVAVIVCGPAVFSAKLKLPVPFVNGPSPDELT